MSPHPTPHLLTTTYYPCSLSQLPLSGLLFLVRHPPGLTTSPTSPGHTMLMGSVSQLNSHLPYPAVPVIGQPSVAIVLTHGTQFGAAVTAYVHSGLNGDHSPDHFQKQCSPYHHHPFMPFLWTLPLRFLQRRHTHVPPSCRTVCLCSTTFLTSFGGRTHTTMTRIIWCDSRQIGWFFCAHL
ncbi:hypothetical protein C8R45DRAFT_1000603 [Mycena sanguinolenta]|nr:hypothetical protein C8R45DRAFT_1000603 [Mycena sanguinolenta]